MQLRPVLLAGSVVLATLVFGSLPGESARRRPCTCGNGVVACAEQCDDGNRTPLDGCSAACQREEPTRCAATSEAAYRAAFGDDPAFRAMEAFARSALGFAPGLVAPLACGEGHGATQYLARLVHPDAAVGDALILSRAGLPGGQGTLLVHETAPRERLVYAPSFAVRLRHRGNGELRDWELLDASGAALASGPPAASHAAASSSEPVSCDQRSAEVNTCIRGALPGQIARLAEFATLTARCLFEIRGGCATLCASCWGVPFLFVAAISFPCPELADFPCATSDCELGWCIPRAYPQSGAACHNFGGGPLLCDPACQECQDGRCVGVALLGAEPQPYFEEDGGCCGPGGLPPGPALALDVCGAPRYPVTITSSVSSCPSGWTCAGGERSFSTPADPLVWPSFGGCCACGAALPVDLVFDLVLTDADGLASEPLSVTTTCVEP